MNCSRVEKLLDRYFEGSLSSERESRLEEHLAICSACRAKYEEREELRELLRAVSCGKEPGERYYERVFARVMAELRQEEERGLVSRAWAGIWGVVSLRWMSLGRLSVAGGLAAMLLIGLGLGILLANRFMEPEGELKLTISEPGVFESADLASGRRYISLGEGDFEPYDNRGLFGVREAPVRTVTVAKSVHDEGALKEGVADRKAAEGGAMEGAASAKLAVNGERKANGIELVANRIRSEGVLDNLQNVKLDLYQSGVEHYIPEVQKIEGVFYDIMEQAKESDRDYLAVLREYRQAESRLLGGEYLEAMRGYYEVAYKQPNSLLGFLSRFQIADIQFEVLRDYDGALSNYKKLLETYPSKYISEEKKELILRRVDLLTRTAGDKWASLRLFEQAQESGAGEARLLYLHLVESYPKSPLVSKALEELVRLGSMSYEGELMPEDMIRAYQRLMEKYPERSTQTMLQVGLGDVLSFQLHNYSQAIVEYNRAIQIGGSTNYGEVARERLQKLYAKREWATIVSK